MSQRKLRLGLVGAGGFGTWFSRYLVEVGDLVAVSDPNPHALDGFKKAVAQNVQTYGHYGDLLNSGTVDAIAITSPNHLHKPIAIAAASAGVHVFCEKAMAPTVADCHEMIAACDRANVKLMVGHKRRLRPPWARMIELRETLGPVVAMSGVCYFDARPDNLQGWWTRKAQSGGLLMLAGVHEIDWMCAMAGSVRAVSAVSAPQIDDRYDFSDSMHVALQFCAGAIGSLSVSLAYPLLRYRQVNGCEVVTRSGGMRLVPSFDRADLYWQQSSDHAPSHEQFTALNSDPVGVDEAFRMELGDFVRWIQHDETPCLTWREGLHCVEVIEAANRSADQQGAWIQLS